jgi:uncharacterized protein YjbI with pentapeptide repeats
MADLKQLEILKQGVDAWNRYVQPGVKINLSWADLQGADLEGAELRGAELIEADLRWAYLRGLRCHLDVIQHQSIVRLLRYLVVRFGLALAVVEFVRSLFLSFCVSRLSINCYKICSVFAFELRDPRCAQSDLIILRQKLKIIGLDDNLKFILRCADFNTVIIGALISTIKCFEVDFTFSSNESNLVEL